MTDAMTNELFSGRSEKSRESVRFLRRHAIRVAVAAAVVAVGMSGQAATLNWDPGTTPATPSGGNGNWDLATQDWSNTVVDRLWSDTSAAGSDFAVFGGTSGTVNLSAVLSAAGITFNTSGYAISGTGTLTLGTGGITANGSASITSNLTLASGGESWSVANGQTLTVNPATFARSAGATVVIQGTAGGAPGTVASTTIGNVSGLSIVGPWMAINSGGTAANGVAGGYNYVTSNGTALVPYTAATQLTTALWTSPGLNTISYDMSGNANMGTNRSANTLRYTGTGGTNTSTATLTINGIMNAGTGTLAFQWPIAVGTNNNNELDVVAGSANLTFLSPLKNTTAAGSVAIFGPGTVTLSNGTSISNTAISATCTYTGATYVNGGTLLVAGTASINTTSGILINGNGAKYVQTSSVASNRTITLTNGTVDGTGTLGVVNVGNLAGNVVQNGNGGSATLTIGTLTFNGAATVNDTLGGGVGLAVPGTLTTTSGAGKVTVNAGGTFVVGLNNLISFGTFTGSVNDFVAGAVTGLNARQSAGAIVLNGNNIALTVNGDFPVWAGQTDGTWVTGGTNNWALNTAHTATNFLAADNVVFNDTVNLNGNVITPASTATISGGVNPSTTVFNNSAVNYAVATSDGTGITSGTVTKNGTGIVTLSSNNSYSGATAVNAGTLQVGSGGVLKGTAIAVASSATFNELAGGSITGGASINSSGIVALSGSNTYTGATNVTAGSFTLAGTSTGAGTMTVTGGNATISGSLTGSAVNVSAGNLSLQGAGAVTNGIITLSGTANFTQTADNAISGTAGITTSVPLTMSRTNNYSGDTTIIGGTNTTLTVTNANAVGSSRISAATGATTPIVLLHIDAGASNSTINMPGSFGGNTGVVTTINVDNNGSSDSNNTIALQGTAFYGGGTLNVTGGHGYNLSIGGFNDNAGSPSTMTLNPTTANLTVGTIDSTTNFAKVIDLDGTSSGNFVTGVIQDSVSTVAVNKTNTSTWTLTGFNQYLGNTTVSGGTLRAGGAFALSFLSNVTMSGGTLDLAGTPQSIPLLTGNAGVITSSVPGSAILTVGASVGNSTFGGVLQDGGAGNQVGVTVGAATLTLTGANNYTGDSTVNGGTGLVFATSHSSVGNVIVNDGGALGVKASSPSKTILTSSSISLGNSNLTFDFGGLSNSNQILISTGTLSLSGTPNVGLLNFSNLPTSLIPLIHYGSLVGNFNSLTLTPGSGAALRTTYQLMNDTTNDNIDLSITSDIPQWVGNLSGTWDIDTAGNGSVGTKNWRTLTSHTATTYQQTGAGNDSVLFDDTATGSTAIDIAANVTPGAVTFNNSSKSYAISSAGGFGIGGTGQLVKSSSGMVSLNTANTYAGGTLLNGGTLNINNASAIGTGALNIGDGTTIDNTSGSPVTLSTNNAINVNGNVTFTGTGDLNLGTGNVTVTPNGTSTSTAFNVNGGNLTVGKIAATGDLVKSGSGTLTINTGVIDNTKISSTTGNLSVTGGTLNIGANDFTAAGINGSGTISDGTATTRWLFINTTGTNTFTGTLTDGTAGGRLGFSVSGVGTVILTGANSYSDVTTINGGATVVMGSPTALGATSNIQLGGLFNAISNGTLVVRTDGGDTLYNMSLGSNNTPTIYSDVLTGNVGINHSLGNLTTGLATLNILAGPNVSSGAPSITFANVVLNAGVGAGATIFNPTTASLSLGNISTSTAANKIVNLDGTAAGNSVTGVISDGNVTLGMGTVALLKSNSSTWSLSGANTFSGGTSITGGTLIVANPQALGTAGVAVHTGGTLKLQSGLAKAVVTPSVTLDGVTGAWSGTVDITNDKLIVESLTKSTDLAKIRDQVGTGNILSSTKAGNYGIAVIDNAVLSTPFATFGGQTVDGNSILVSTEIAGDTNVDGSVDLTDLSTVLNNFGSSTLAWTSGNFDGASTIDLTDLSDVLNNFGASNPSANGLIAGGLASAAPEPSSLLMLGIGGVLVLRRRGLSRQGRN